MDLSNLLGEIGKGKAGALGALLPLLLGGKGVDLGGLLSGALGGNNAFSALAPLFEKKEESGCGAYPPLFGSEEMPLNVLSSMLNSSALSGQNAKTDKKKGGEYPYELQYNRPEPVIKK